MEYCVPKVATMSQPLFTDLDGSGVPQIKLNCSDINTRPSV